MRALFRFMDWPLRAKMAALLVVASLIPLGVAALVDIREARQRLQATTSSLLAARADHLVDQLDTFHRGYQTSVDGLAQLPDVMEFCRATPHDAERLKPALRAVLDVQPATDANVRGVALLDLRGIVTLATEDPLVGMDLSYHKYVREALVGAAVMSDIYLAAPQVGNAPTIAYLAGARARPQNHRVCGLLGSRNTLVGHRERIKRAGRPRQLRCPLRSPGNTDCSYVQWRHCLPPWRRARLHRNRRARG